MSKIYGFNTGRCYQADGQRISWVVSEDRAILFNDHSRGISGRLTEDHEDLLPGERLDSRFVLAAYDRGHYCFDHRADAVNAASWPKL